MTTFEHGIVGGGMGVLACGLDRRYGWPIISAAGLAAISPDWDGLTLLYMVQEEFHSERFSREGGTLEMVQLWVNLPAKEKNVAAALPGNSQLANSPSASA